MGENSRVLCWSLLAMRKDTTELMLWGRIVNLEKASQSISQLWKRMKRVAAFFRGPSFTFTFAFTFVALTCEEVAQTIRTIFNRHGSRSCVLVSVVY